jgi:capsular polysaccharide biosynthesis protein
LIENRGDKWIFHWYLYMLSGLRHINLNTSRNGYNCNWGRSNPPIIEERNTEYYNAQNIIKPYNISFRNINIFETFQKESLDLIGEYFKVINYEDITEDDIIIFNYGEHILNNQYHIDTEGYQFLRNIFLKKVNVTNSKHNNKKYYISRNKSHELLGNSGIKRRQINNEYHLMGLLKKYNIEKISLEDYTTEEKIEIFHNSSLIISPNSGALTFTLFSGNKLKIVELNVHNPGQIDFQYKNQCEFFKIPYYKFVTDKIDGDDNMNVNIEQFDIFLKNLI